MQMLSKSPGTSLSPGLRFDGVDIGWRWCCIYVLWREQGRAKTKQVGLWLSCCTQRKGWNSHCRGLLLLLLAAAAGFWGGFGFFVGVCPASPGTLTSISLMAPSACYPSCSLSVVGGRGP